MARRRSASVAWAWARSASSVRAAMRVTSTWRLARSDAVDSTADAPAGAATRANSAMTGPASSSLRTGTVSGMRVGVLTGGGDCPGLNAVIRAVVRKGERVYGDEIVGFLDGWKGVIEGRTLPLD